MQATFKNLFTIYEPYTHQGLSNLTTFSSILSGATVPLKVHWCDNYDYLDFHDFYIIKPFWVGDFGAKV